MYDLQEMLETVVVTSGTLATVDLELSIAVSKILHISVSELDGDDKHPFYYAVKYFVNKNVTTNNQNVAGLFANVSRGDGANDNRNYPIVPLNMPIKKRSVDDLLRVALYYKDTTATTRTFFIKLLVVTTDWKKTFGWSINSFLPTPFLQFFIWEGNFTLTQTNVAGGNCVLYITPEIGSWMEIIGIRIGYSDYAAARTCSADLYRGATVIHRFTSGIAVDNAPLHWPGLGAATAANSEPTVRQMVLVSPQNRINITGTALAENETLKVDIRARVPWRVPAVDETSSTGTVTLTTNINHLV